MRSSNCFNGESWTTDSVIKETSASHLRIGSVEQSGQSRRGFLWDREHFAEVCLRRNQLGLFGLLRGLIFCQQVFYLTSGLVVINCLLQSIPFRIGLAKPTATALTARTTATVASAHHPAHTAAHANI